MISLRNFFSSLSLVAIFLAASGCGGWLVKRTDAGPAARIMVARGNQAYAKLDYQSAWEAYRKAEALGVRSAIVSYRVDVLREALGAAPLAGNQKSPFRHQTLKLLEEALGDKGHSGPAVFFYLAQVRQALDGDGRRSTRLYGDAIRNFEKNKFSGLNAEGYEFLARMYLALGLGRAAEKLLLESQKRNPLYALAAYSLGKFYRRAGRHGDAIKQFERLLRVAPSDTEGYIMLGHSALETGEYARAQTAFKTALALDSTNGDARAGFQRAKRVVARKNRLRKQARSIAWEVGFETPLTPLTLPTDGLEFNNAALGSPSFGSDGSLTLTSGSGERFQVYTLSDDGMRLNWRALSSTGFSGFAGEPDRVLLSIGHGRGRETGVYNSSNKIFKMFRRGYCEQPNFSSKARALLCVTPQGVILADLNTDRLTAIYRESGGRHPRFSRDGSRVVLADGDLLVWLERSGEEIGRLRLPGGRASASYPDFSPDGRWIVSGESGLHLTSVEKGKSVPLSNTLIEGGKRPVFSPDGDAVVFEQDGRLYRLGLPKKLESFFSFHLADRLLWKRKYADVVRLLRVRPRSDQDLSAYHLLMGRSLFGLEFYGKAESSAIRASILARQDWRPVLLLGNLKAAQGDWETSARLMDRVVELGPDRFEGYFHRAKIRIHQGRREDAVGDYRTAIMRIKGAPAHWGEEALIGLLDLYMEMGGREDALLLLLEHSSRLGTGAVRRIRLDPRYRHLRADPRFNEIMPSDAAPMPGRDDKERRPGKFSAIPREYPSGPNLHNMVRRPIGRVRTPSFSEWNLKNKELGVHVFW